MSSSTEPTAECVIADRTTHCTTHDRSILHCVAELRTLYQEALAELARVKQVAKIPAK